LHPDSGALDGRAGYYNWLTNAYHLLGQHETELEAAQRARRRFPRNLATLRMELLALAALGRGREVNQHFDEIEALPPDPIRLPAPVMREIALDLAAHGDSAAARVDKPPTGARASRRSRASATRPWTCSHGPSTRATCTRFASLMRMWSPASRRCANTPGSKSCCAPRDERTRSSTVTSSRSSSSYTAARPPPADRCTRPTRQPAPCPARCRPSTRCRSSPADPRS